MATKEKAPKILSTLNLIQRLRFRIFGMVYLEHRQNEGWRAPLPFYLVNCSKHGPFEDNPHGHMGVFRCPKCMDEVREATLK